MKDPETRETHAHKTKEKNGYVREGTPQSLESNQINELFNPRIKRKRQRTQAADKAR